MLSEANWKLAYAFRHAVSYEAMIQDGSDGNSRYRRAFTFRDSLDVLEVALPHPRQLGRQVRGTATCKD